MSSYLTLYGVPQEGKPISFYCVSRNHPVYQAINDVLNPTHCGMDDEPHYSTLTFEGLQEVISNLRDEVTKCDNRIALLKEHAGGNIEIINELESWVDMRNEYVETLYQLDFLSVMVEDVKDGYSGFTKILMNVG